MNKVKPETNNQLAVRVLAKDLISRYNGEIFREFWDDMISENTPVPTYSVKGYYVNHFLKENMLPYCQEIFADDPSDVESETLIAMINNGQELAALTLYFECNGYHGEYAGTAMAACYLDGNYNFALVIHSKLDEEGFDS